MNTLESYSITSPKNVSEECAKFIIDDTGFPFILSEIMTIGTRYTLSFWIKSETNSSILVCGNTFVSTTEWQKYSITFEATGFDFAIKFLATGTYYIYHPKLELGNMATDWSPAPEDTDDKLNASVDSINNAKDDISRINGTISDLRVESSGIAGRVEKVESDVTEVSGHIGSINKDISNLKLSSYNMELSFKKITDDGVSKVTTTEHGFTFDDEGMTVDSSDSLTKTQVTPDGMTVYRKDAAGKQDEVLQATSEGVIATNLHANTYLIIGGRSRFENYGSNRTGCFWIGG